MKSDFSEECPTKAVRMTPLGNFVPCREVMRKEKISVDRDPCCFLEYMGCTYLMRALHLETVLMLLSVYVITLRVHTRIFSNMILFRADGRLIIPGQPTWFFRRTGPKRINCTAAFCSREGGARSRPTISSHPAGIRHLCHGIPRCQNQTYPPNLNLGVRRTQDIHPEYSVMSGVGIVSLPHMKAWKSQEASKGCSLYLA